MKRFVGLFTWIMIASGWSMATLQFGAAQANEPQPADIRIDHDVLVEDQRLAYIFLGVLHGTGLRGGFVEMAVCSDLPKGRLQIKQGATVQQAMGALVAANPGYQWELKDGVVNLMPRGAAPLLRTRIAKFQMDATDREIPAVLQDLLRLAEVRNSAAALGLKQEAIGQDNSAGPGDARSAPRQPVPVHINLQDLSLQEAFNEVLAFSPGGVWIYRETGCNESKRYSVEVASD